METMEKIAKQYARPIKHELALIRRALREDGWKVSDVYEMSDEDYSFNIYVSRYDANPSETLEGDIDIAFRIMQSEVWDGSEDGMNFGVDVTTVGGSMLGGCTPFNYSDKVWVARDDEDAVSDRWDLLSQCDADGMVCLLEDHKKYDGPEAE